MVFVGVLVFIAIWAFAAWTAEIAYFQDTAEDYFGHNNKRVVRCHRTVAGLAALIGMCVALSFANVSPKHTGDLGARRINGFVACAAGTMSAFTGTMLFNIGYEVTRDHV